MRLVPHDQDTGGFFVCVLQKAGHTSDNDPATEPAIELPPVLSLDEVVVADESGASSLKRAASPSAGASSSEAKRTKQEPKKPKRDLGFKEDPYSFVDPSHAEVRSIK